MNKLNEKLFEAFENQNIDEIEALLKKGADINSTDESNETILYKAITGENLDLVKFLLEKGADIEISNCEGYSPLIRSIIDKNIEVFYFLIENGSDINHCDNHDNSPLLYAMEYGLEDENISFFDYLLEKNADIYINNDEGYSVLDILKKGKEEKWFNYTDETVNYFIKRLENLED